MVEQRPFLRQIFNRVGTVVLALVLAIIVWVVAVNQEDPSIQNEFPEAIPIEIHNQPPDTIFFGEVQDSVYVTIRARAHQLGRSAREQLPGVGRP